MTDDVIKKLDEVLDEADSISPDYIGKTYLYRCPSCGLEKYVKGTPTDEVVCDDCGTEMVLVEEEDFDKQQDEDEKSAGKTEIEELQDDEDELEKDETDDSIGNLTDLDEADEEAALKAIEELEVEVPEEEIGLPEEENEEEAPHIEISDYDLTDDDDDDLGLGLGFDEDDDSYYDDDGDY